MPAGAMNRNCKGCRLSKVKCDWTEVADGASCSRCIRLHIECVREARGNLSTGARRISNRGVVALRLEKKRTERSCGVEEHAGTGVMTEVEIVELVSQRAVPRALLQRCGRLAWARNDTSFMAWTLQQAARHGIPLLDFVPAVRVHPEPPGVPPPFIRELLGGSEVAVAYVMLGGDSFWIANDRFDQDVCSRSTLHDARELTVCDASTLFSPRDEVEAFDKNIINPLVTSLMPTSFQGASFASDDEECESDARQSAPLMSELKDSTSLWRVYYRPAGCFVCCSVEFRCAVSRGGGEMWIVGKYSPLRAPNGSWLTTTNQPPLLRGIDSSPPLSSPPRKRPTLDAEIIEPGYLSMQELTEEAELVEELEAMLPTQLVDASADDDLLNFFS
ncbi:hypothetical protein AB1Y20_018173 [Prymnesium parvum]|uniref:Zn(2)-C6 fungal-type domain-containing protein n=1 Tax=Prymnesium parvum TaxID=97485 RepID=A0AB34JMW6_PRYPA